MFDVVVTINCLDNPTDIRVILPYAIGVKFQPTLSLPNFFDIFLCLALSPFFLVVLFFRLKAGPFFFQSCRRSPNPHFLDRHKGPLHLEEAEVEEMEEGVNLLLLRISPILRPCIVRFSTHILSGMTYLIP